MEDSAKSLFKRSSKTYFGATRFFPKDVRADVYILYGFVRMADDFVDQIPQDREGFSFFRSQYTEAMSGATVGVTIIDDFVALVRRVGIDPVWVDAFLNAMESDLEWEKKDTLDDTLSYVYGSAEVIGLMMARILSLPKESFLSARMLGRSMQYVNFIRDIAEDDLLGRTYFPQTELAAAGLSDLSSETFARNSEQSMQFLHTQIARYREWQQEAETGFMYLPVAFRVAIATASDMYAWTLQKIEKNPSIVHQRKVRPSRLRVFFAGVRRSWIERDSIVKALITASRPRFWLYLGGTYLVGAVFGASTLSDLMDWPVLLFLLYFLVPANLFLYGINDIADRDTDALNEKKDGIREQRLSGVGKKQMAVVVGAFISGMMGVFLLFTGFSRGIHWYLVLFLVLSILYSVPPVRFKARPFFDFSSNILYALPGFIGFVQLSGEHLPLPAIVFAWCWTSAMHLFSAIPDIVPDKAVGLKTTAVVLGRERSLVVCAVLWMGFSFMALFAPIAWPLKIMSFAYPVIPLLLLGKGDGSIERMYWIFPWVNALGGFLLFLGGVASLLF